METQIKIASYNPFMRPINLFKDGQIERSEQIPDAMISKIPDLDVIVFNGMCDDAARATTVHFFETHGFHYSTDLVGGRVFHKKRNKKVTMCTGGQFILSKYPIEFFKSCSDIGAVGLSYAAIRKDRFRFHLVACNLSDTNNISDKNHELMTMKNFIQKLHIPTYEPILIAGRLGCDYLRTEGSLISDIMQKLGATIPEIESDSFRATYSSANTMAGKDGRKPPYHDEWHDYGLYLNRYKPPKSSSLSCIQIQPSDPISIYKSCCCCCRVKKKIFRDLSPHYPVIMTATF